MFLIILLYSLALTGLIETAKNTALKPLAQQRQWTSERYVQIVNALALLLALVLSALANGTEPALWIGNGWVARALVFASILVLVNHLWHGALDIFDALVTIIRRKAGYV